MAGFQPNSSQHAIIEAVFALRFDRFFDGDELKLIDDARDEEPFLPARQELKLPGFSPGIGEPFNPAFPSQISAPAVGYEYARIRPDGAHEWLMRVEQDQVFISCRAYTRWSKVWSTASENLAWVCGALARRNINLKSASLNYVDRFNWTGDLAGYDLLKLFKENNPYFVPGSFGNQPLWHCHVGWFEDASGAASGRLLTKIHSSGHTESVKGGERRAYVIIVTEQELFPASPVKAGSFFNETEPEKNRPADEWMDYLHERDKKILGDILTDEQTENISLQQGGQHA